MIMNSIKIDIKTGFTLVEIMIAVSLLVIVVGSLIAVLVGGVRNFTAMSDDSASDYSIHILFSQLNRDLIEHGAYAENSSSTPLQIGQTSNSIKLSKPIRIDSKTGDVIHEETHYEFDAQSGRLSRNGHAFKNLQFASFDFTVKKRALESSLMVKELQTLVVNYKLREADQNSSSSSSLATIFEFNLWHANEKTAFNQWNSPIQALGTD